MRNQALTVRGIFETFQHFGIRPETLHSKWNDDSTSAFPRRAFDESTNALLGFSTLIRPILTQRFHLHGMKRLRPAHDIRASIQLLQPALVLGVIARAMRENQYIFLRGILAQHFGTGRED